MQTTRLPTLVTSAYTALDEQVLHSVMAMKSGRMSYNRMRIFFLVRRLATDNYVYLLV